MLPMIHGIEQLILVHETPNGEVDQAGKYHFPGVPKYAVNNAYDED